VRKGRGKKLSLWVGIQNWESREDSGRGKKKTGGGETKTFLEADWRGPRLLELSLSKKKEKKEIFLRNQRRKIQSALPVPPERNLERRDPRPLPAAGNQKRNN